MQLVANRCLRSWWVSALMPTLRHADFRAPRHSLTRRMGALSDSTPRRARISAMRAVRGGKIGIVRSLDSVFVPAIVSRCLPKSKSPQRRAVASLNLAPENARKRTMSAQSRERLARVVETLRTSISNWVEEGRSSRFRLVARLEIVAAGFL